MNLLQKLERTGYVSGIYPFSGSDLRLFEEISNEIRDLETAQRKDVFGYSPDVMSVFRKAADALGIACELTRYCFYIEKSAEMNWPLALHRDLNFPDYIKKRDFEQDVWIESGFWLRVNLDNSSIKTGALKVVPGSHKHSLKDIKKTDSIFLENKAGEVILFKPSLLHGSNKMSGGEQRRRVFQAFCLLGR